MRVDDMAGDICQARPPPRPPRRGAWQILLATSQDAMSLKKRGFKMRVDDVAGNGPGRYLPPRHRVSCN